MIDIEKVEKLAALKLKEEEKKRIQKDLEEIIHYFEILKEVDTEKTEPHIYAKSAHLFLREDEIKNGLRKEDLKRNKSLFQNKFYKVKRIIGE